MHLDMYTPQDAPLDETARELMDGCRAKLGEWVEGALAATNAADIARLGDVREDDDTPISDEVWVSWESSADMPGAVGIRFVDVTDGEDVVREPVKVRVLATDVRDLTAQDVTHLRLVALAVLHARGLDATRSDAEYDELAASGLL